MPQKRLNLVLKGEPAEWLEGWLNRGLATSVTDAVLLAFRAFHEHIVEQDLKEVRLQTLQNLPKNRNKEELKNVEEDKHEI